MTKILSEEPILAKIQQLRDKFLNADISDHRMIDDWEARAKKALITNSLKKHEGILMIIEKIKEDIKDINDVLVTAKSNELSDSERNSLIDVKKFYKWFLQLFTDSREVLESIDKEIEDQLTQD